MTVSCGFTTALRLHGDFHIPDIDGTAWLCYSPDKEIEIQSIDLYLWDAKLDKMTDINIGPDFLGYDQFRAAAEFAIQNEYEYLQMEMAADAHLQRYDTKRKESY